jgi:tetratricopeptide (TPR) repeat protein
MSRAQIFTFYSYKGGSGRTMALANTAWILASNGNKVLALDWDLEAPGLHRYFAPFLPDPELSETKGLIDFFFRYVEAATTERRDDEAPNDRWHERYADLGEYAQPLEWKFNDGGRIDFVPAGCQNESYSTRTNTFDWRGFYERFSGGAFVECVVAAMRRDYDYVLIDSRTGVSDTAGICTVQLPDCLAVFFTANNQSIRGAWSVANDVGSQRRTRPVRILPVFTRVEQSEHTRLELTRTYVRTQFESLLREQSIDSGAYWPRVEIFYVPIYAYEEILATFQDQQGEKGTVLGACEALTELLTAGAVTALQPPTETERNVVQSKFRRASPLLAQRRRLGEETFFICYSQRNRRWFERLRVVLRALVPDKSIDVWSDAVLRAGDPWSTMEERLSRARVVVLLVSPDLLASNSFAEVTLPTVRTHVESRGLAVIWLPISASLYQATEIAQFQAAYDPSRPLDTLAPPARNRALLEISQRIIDVANLSGGALPTISESRERQKFPTVVQISRVPSASQFLVGREKELARIDEAWNTSREHIITLVGRGGEGKSSLVRHWLNAMSADGWRGAERVFAWSFYSQGFTDRAASADEFIHQALRFFGETHPEAITPYERGERLAQLVGASRNLLILDGLESLQYPPGRMEGRLKDPALQSLLSGLSAQNNGLCVITSRASLPELAGGKYNVSPEIELLPLTLTAGAQFLKSLGVAGSEEERQEVVARLGGHALSLNLLGSYLVEAYDGDIQRAGEVLLLDQDQLSGAHAHRILRSYESWLSDGSDIGEQMLAILRLTGLFDGPAPSEWFDVLGAPPAIKGLTDSIVNRSPAEWNRAMTRLRNLRLLTDDKEVIDAHPLIREYFAQRLTERFSQPAREAHQRLYEHLSKSAAEFPGDVAAMMMLYRAVRHGAHAGLWTEALNDVYYRRIQRGEESFATATLGTIGLNLAALGSFFAEPWRRPVPALSISDQAYVLAEVGGYLQAQGRARETQRPLEEALELYQSVANWRNASLVAFRLSDLGSMNGDVMTAILAAERSLELSERSDDVARQITAHAVLGDALHAAGVYDAAFAAFAEAESVPRSHGPADSWLISLNGFRYCDLMLESGRLTVEEVRERAELMLQVSEQNAWLLETALHHLILGRTFLDSQRERAKFHLEKSVRRLREAGTQHWLPLGLIRRAAVQRRMGDFLGAGKDLREAEEISVRGELRRWLIEAALERVRLYAADGQLPEAREKLREARMLVKETNRRYVSYQRDWSEWHAPVYLSPLQNGQEIGYGRSAAELDTLEALVNP